MDCHGKLRFPRNDMFCGVSSRGEASRNDVFFNKNMSKMKAKTDIKGKAIFYHSPKHARILDKKKSERQDL